MVLIEDIEFRVMQVHITKTFTAALHLSSCRQPPWPRASVWRGRSCLSHRRRKRETASKKKKFNVGASANNNLASMVKHFVKIMIIIDTVMQTTLVAPQL